MIIVKRREPVADVVQSQNELPDILKKIYQHRGICPNVSLEKSLSNLHPYHLLKDVDKAAQRIYQALVNNEKIIIIGDFDSDGATSTAVAVSALTMFGAKNVDYLVPNRFDFGYGLSPEIVDVAAKESPQLIITVDNGIANHQGVSRAKALGIDVIITDHHLAAETLPEADVIVNPNQPDDQFPSKNLAGVGVIFYVMLALRSLLREQSWFAEQSIAEPNMANLLDLVALGTVADVVPLDYNNRILVHQGLLRIRHGHVRPGIKALLAIANRQESRVIASDFGFAIAPRLNAAGRLDDMSIGIKCLLEPDYQQAMVLAQQLDCLNHERKAIESQMQQDAFKALEQLKGLEQKSLPLGVCIYQPDWHQGVIGILASRVKDKLHRPVIAFAKGNDGELKGSARSVQGIHIRDILANIANYYPELILKFGGHAMAAGLTIKEKDFTQFQKAFADEVATKLTEDDLQHIILSDGELPEYDFNLQLAEKLRYLEPWGQHFPEPVFDGEFQIHNQRIVGQNHLKLLLGIPNSERMIDAIAFNVDMNIWPNYHCQTIFAVYKLDINEYRGRQDLQLIIDYLEVKS